jgi:hypothetical protein
MLKEKDDKEMDVYKLDLLLSFFFRIRHPDKK